MPATKAGIFVIAFLNQYNVASIPDPEAITT